MSSFSLVRSLAVDEIMLARWQRKLEGLSNPEAECQTLWTLVKELADVMKPDNMLPR